MVESYIEYKGKRHPIKEPTIKSWSEIMRMKEMMEPSDLFIKVIELTTGLTRDQIMESDATEIQEVGEKVLSIINGSTKQVIRKFTHKDVEYEFVDVHNISFGQYIDVDTFLSKDERYRIQNLNELAAYLFSETGKKYGETNIQERIKNFEDLPIRYMEGAVFFLLSSARISDALTQIYSQSQSLKLMMKTKIVFRLIGAGIKRLAHSVRTKFGYLIMLLTYPLFSASIISLTLWTLIRSKKK
jgi:hypothetical protein